MEAVLLEDVWIHVKLPSPQTSFGGGRQGVTIYASAGSAVVGEEAKVAERGLVRGQGGNAVLIFFMPAPVRGERRTLSVAEAEAEAKKGELAPNSEEAKEIEDKG